tara:strand:- start:312 stop:491 length:180 start_codon:yes stop_codon:yes gene_type:complete
MERIFANEKKIKSLMTKHEFFDSLIEQKLKSLSVDDLEINLLKKKKLLIKDKIRKLSNN